MGKKGVNLDNVVNFWEVVAPALVDRFDWGKGLASKVGKSGWNRGLQTVVTGMDDEEFNLFMAQVVMAAASKQIMGEELTKKIKFLKGLRR